MGHSPVLHSHNSFPVRPIVANSGRNVHCVSDKFLDVQFIEPATCRPRVSQVVVSKHIRTFGNRWHGKRKWDQRQEMQDENMNATENYTEVIQVDEVNFDSEVLQAKQPVLVAFVTTWSHACAILAPVLDEIAAERDGQLKVVRVNADTNLDLSLWYDVQSIPTLLYFVHGNVRAKVVGTASKQAILTKLQLT